MDRGHLMNSKHSGTLLILGITGAAVLWASPAEATLGDAVKLIYVHMALAWLGLAIFSAAGVAGLLHLLLGREALHSWSRAFAVVGVFLWLVYLVLSMASMQISWGGILWQEPRFTYALVMMALSSGFWAVGRLVERPRVDSLLSAVLAGIMWVYLLRTARFFHPVNPVWTSDSTAMKVSAALITLIFFAAALDVVWWLRRRQSAVRRQSESPVVSA